jgi:hypothetical protein
VPSSRSPRGQPVENSRPPAGGRHPLRGWPQAAPSRCVASSGTPQPDRARRQLR